ncbi:MAG: precorrin-6Y C5,15-methyltransferase (decarboxylating) subunit CbiT, partial [Candidatus Methanomethylophilaceae archaeon]
IDDADLLVGAKRMLGILPAHGKDTLPEYECKKVLSFLDEHKEYKKVAVLLSGDVGFHSGAKQFRENVNQSEYELISVCGISSVVYFCSRINIPWDDVFLMSAHSDDSANIIGEVRRHGKVFTLVRGKEGLQKLCNDLLFYGMDVQMIAAQNLGNPNELIVRGNPSEILDAGLSGLCVTLIVNERPITSVPMNIRDEDFIRGDAPMTKAEIRTLSVAKLELSDDSVIYDVGAGTGSVSIMMALIAVNGKVFAIEKEKEAVSLIHQNRRKFCTPNLVVIEGSAPDMLADLPVPTHAFIGGSSGNMEEILTVLLNKNPKIRIVMNSITLETVSETLRCVKKLGLREETACINSSRSRLAGDYHLMIANNPVHITVIQGRV